MTVNKDGSVTLNGTCTRSDIFYLVLPLYPMTYTLSCDYTGTLPQNENPRCQIYAPDNTPLGISIRNDAKPDAKSTVTFNKYSEAYFRIRIENGHTYNNVTLRPMLYYGADTKPFEPYTGGFPSPRPQMRLLLITGYVQDIYLLLLVQVINIGLYMLCQMRICITQTKPEWAVTAAVCPSLKA